jgi:hypothetical protein
MRAAELPMPCCRDDARHSKAHFAGLRCAGFYSPITLFSASFRVFSAFFALRPFRARA